MLLNLFHPPLGTLETIGVSNVVDYDSSVGPLIVKGSHALISLLTCRFPDVKSDPCFTEVDGAFEKNAAGIAPTGLLLNSPLMYL